MSKRIRPKLYVFSKYDYLVLPIEADETVQFPDPDELFRPDTVFLPVECKRCHHTLILMDENIESPEVVDRQMGTEKIYSARLEGHCMQCDTILEADADFGVYADGWWVSDAGGKDVEVVVVQGLDSLVTTVRELKKAPDEYD